MLTDLAKTGDDFAKSFNVFLTYPFVDEVVGRDPEVARNLHMGDYTNLSIELDIDVVAARARSAGPAARLDPGQIVDTLTKCLRSGDLNSKACKKCWTTRTLHELREGVRRHVIKTVCKQLPDPRPAVAPGSASAAARCRRRPCRRHPLPAAGGHRDPVAPGRETRRSTS